jgi:predicted nucleic acid-binding protein
MPGTVSNSTPLIHLAKIGQLELLRDFFGTLWIPPAVYRECVDEGKAYPGCLASRRILAG